MKIVLSPEYQSMAEAVARLPLLMEQGGGDVVYDGRNRVCRFVVDGQRLMVKRFKRANAVQRVAYTFFRPTKAARAFRYAAEFNRRGISTPAPVAYMEQRGSGLFTVGFFVSTEAPGIEASRLLREVPDYPSALAEAVARQVVFMHSRGVLHGDLNLTNFLCTEADGDYVFSMIDINRSRFTDGFPSRDACMDNLVRLTHRRDLYEDLVRRYARQRQWDEASAVADALCRLHRFEHRRWHF